MKIKTIFIIIALILIAFNVTVTANRDNMDFDNALKPKNNNSNNLENIDVRVAVLENIKPFDEFIDYEWIVGNRKYKLDLEIVYDEGVLRGKLNTDKYDVIVVPGGGVGDREAGIRCFPTIRNHIWKRNFAGFIKDGGGFYGVCGGAVLITDLDLERRPRSFLEYAFEKSSLDITRVKSHYKNVAQAFFCELGGLPPEYVGVGAYFLYMGWYMGENRSPYSPYGVCFDCPVNTNHPIFDDFLETTRRVNWIGGPSLSIPEQYIGEVDVLLNYPEEEMSDNESTKMYAWKYTGGIRGLLKGVVEAFKHGQRYAYWFAEGWKCTDKLIETDYSNQPAMTSEIYPNENSARIVLTGLHPEHATRWGGQIEKQDEQPLNLYYGFYQWKNITLFNETPEDEFSYNMWLNSRAIAWASKIVPNNDLPPIYGPSQISDIYPYEQTSDFTIIGNSLTSNGTESLDLYYRYSGNNESWDDWTYYNTDYNITDGWSWIFDSPNGTGYYQFYSIRHVKFGDEELIENAPNGPDAVAYIN